MRMLLLAAAALLAAPAGAHAEATLTSREVPLHGARSLAAASPRQFDLVGLHWRGSGSVEFRTRSTGGRWGPWRTAAPEAEDLPDDPEGMRSNGWRIGNPYWTGPSDKVAYRLRGTVSRLRAYFVSSPSDGLPPRRLSVAGSPSVIPRLSWGANEAIRRAPPAYAGGVHFALVHHTAGANTYSPAQSAAIVRGIEIYHVKGNGWNDIGYNFLVDRYGQVFEGRYGGVGRNVIGAHAEGFNTGSVGVAVIGTYGSAQPSVAAQTALAGLLAWRLDLAHADPLSTLTWTSGGNPRFPAGTPVFLRAISGHRDTGFTSCPGNALYARLGAVAAQVAAVGLPKLYDPLASGDPGALVRFRGRLTTALPWVVTVTDPSGATVATGTGTSTEIDWAWDAATAPKGRYAWTISAGADVRAASGFVGAVPIPLTLGKPLASPATISPNADGKQDRSTITYRLSASATVTAALRAPDGRQLATLFRERKRPGKQSFAFTADGVADGRYSIVLSASDGKVTVVSEVAILVDRTLGGFKLASAAFSPNGDGRRDALELSFLLARSAHVRVEVKQGKPLVAALYMADLNAGPQTVGWDGLTSGKPAADGVYAAVVTVATPLGVVVHTLPFRIDTRAPVLRAVSFRRLVFRVDEPARVRVVADRRAYFRSVRAGRFSLGRSARVVSARADDVAGNVSRTLRWHR